MTPSGAAVGCASKASAEANNHRRATSWLSPDRSCQHGDRAVPQGINERRVVRQAIITAMGPDLSDLMVRSAHGDESAFAQLYDATAARIYGLVVRA